MPADTSKIAANLQRFAMAINAHDRENPTHTAYGIGLNPFDMERLGFEEGEQVVAGITIQADSGETGNFRVLCDGDHLEELEAADEEVVEAVSTQQVSVPVGAPPTPERDPRR
ncbi:MAG: hypothetical protein QOJ46_1985 [bacterium]